MIIKIRKVLAWCLIFITITFTYQNLSWVYGLYGAGPQSGIQVSRFNETKIPNNNSIYLVKTRMQHGKKEFIYRFSLNDYFKLPVWPFLKTVVSDHLYQDNLVLVENLFNCDFNQIKIFDKYDIDSFTDIIIVMFVISLIMAKILMGRVRIKHAEACLGCVNKNIYY